MNATPERDRGWRQWTALAVALLLLNAAISFYNVWPTPAVHWERQVAPELVICLLLLVAASTWLRPPSRLTLRLLSAVWVVLLICRYAEVTAPALYGREVNLYWDMRHMRAVGEMLAVAAPLRLVLLALAATVLILGLLYAAIRWAFGRVGDALAQVGERRVIGTLTVVAAVVMAGQIGSDLRRPVYQDYEDEGPKPAERLFSVAVTPTFARQAKLAARAIAARSGSIRVAPSPPMNADLSNVRGTDVLVFFFESYGAVTYDRPELAHALAASRADLDAAVRETGRQVVSAFAQSPTFGGQSWLAHLNLLSGLEIKDQDEYELLMAQKRETLVTTFKRHGYSTIAIMPGIWQTWPEGAFYGFDDIYGGNRLEYKGPQFGWWDIPDQFSIAWLDAHALAGRSRAPVFGFFTTITSHTPFSPVPPYQPDWSRVLTPTPYDHDDVMRTFAQVPDWLNLGPSYARSVAYDYETIAGYFRARPDTNAILILLGDHQPPAAVSGEGATWDVPVHVFGRSGAVLDYLQSHGFTTGMYPKRPTVSRIHQLLPLLFDAFGGREPTP